MKHRSACSTLAQLQTGHCGLNSYLYRFNKVESAQCQHCGHNQDTVEHFLLECDKHWETRSELHNKVGTGNMMLANLLGKKELVGATLEFVAATGRFKEDADRGREERWISGEQRAMEAQRNGRELNEE